jgi:molecular chaperone GrpE
MFSDELPQAEPGTDDLQALSDQLQEEQKRSAENLAGWQRAAADLANYRRRAEQEKNDLLKYGKSALILKILPVLDDFDRAVATMSAARPDDEKWVDGILLVHRKLQAIMEAEGLKPIAAVGASFDPAVHEAVLQEDVTESDKDAKVISELQKGYTLNDRVLRPTMVKVGRKVS